MMRTRGGAVLVVTDLTPTSDAALLAAGELACSHNIELHVLRALELRNRPLREVLISLEQIGEAVERARAAVQAQIARLLPDHQHCNPPIIELDSRDVAIRRCVRHISPSYVVYADGGEIVVRDERASNRAISA